MRVARMRRPIWTCLSANCVHCVPFFTFKRSSEKDEVRLSLSYAGAIQDRACFMTIGMCSYC